MEQHFRMKKEYKEGEHLEQLEKEGHHVFTEEEVMNEDKAIHLLGIAVKILQFGGLKKMIK